MIRGGFRPRRRRSHQGGRGMLRILTHPHIATAVVLAGAMLAVGSAPVRAQGASAGSVTATELEPIPKPSIAYNRMAIAMGLPQKHGLDLKLGPDLAGGGPERIQAV